MPHVGARGRVAAGLRGAQVALRGALAHEAGEDDVEVKVGGVTIIVGPDHAELLKELTVDYVQLDSGEHNFIFINPADPNYSPGSE